MARVRPETLGGVERHGKFCNQATNAYKKLMWHLIYVRMRTKTAKFFAAKVVKRYRDRHGTRCELLGFYAREVDRAQNG